MLTAVYYHLLITGALAALFALVVLAQCLATALGSSLSRSAHRDTARVRHGAPRIAGSRT